MGRWLLGLLSSRFDSPLHNKVNLIAFPETRYLIRIPGHAGAMLQARQLGTELVVGIHSDESILENKGPTVMTLEER